MPSSILPQIKQEASTISVPPINDRMLIMIDLPPHLEQTLFVKVEDRILSPYPFGLDKSSLSSTLASSRHHLITRPPNPFW